MKQSTTLKSKVTKKQEIIFTTGSIPKAMLLFSVPFMFGVLLQNLYGAVDLFVVGHYATTADVSAVTIGSQLMSIVTQLIIGFATGITMLIGQAYGAKDRDRLAKTTGTSILLFGTIAILLTLTYFLLHRVLVSLMQTPSEAVAATKAYLLACTAGIPFIVGYNVIAGILTGRGDSKTPFLFIAIACVINIVLDIILVKYFYLGAFGAAIATTIAQIGSFLFSLLFLWHRGLGFTVSKTDLRFDRSQTKKNHKNRWARSCSKCVDRNVIFICHRHYQSNGINRFCRRRRC